MTPEATEIDDLAFLFDTITGRIERGLPIGRHRDLTEALEKHGKLVARLLRAEAVRVNGPVEMAPE